MSAMWYWAGLLATMSQSVCFALTTSSSRAQELDSDAQTSMRSRSATSSTTTVGHHAVRDRLQLALAAFFWSLAPSRSSMAQIPLGELPTFWPS
ncbi:hypothetical protein C8R47DRAFT_1122257 [Mycena vitilis]|nr:hypothetical protein C8R47DRAFT_1122257 [Mycena vitilis]